MCHWLPRCLWMRGSSRFLCTSLKGIVIMSITGDGFLKLKKKVSAILPCLIHVTETGNHFGNCVGGWFDACSIIQVRKSQKVNSAHLDVAFSVGETFCLLDGLLCPDWSSTSSGKKKKESLMALQWAQLLKFSLLPFFSAKMQKFKRSLHSQIKKHISLILVLPP